MRLKPTRILLEAMGEPGPWPLCPCLSLLQLTLGTCSWNWGSFTSPPRSRMGKLLKFLEPSGLVSRDSPPPPTHLLPSYPHSLLQILEATLRTAPTAGHHPNSFPLILTSFLLIIPAWQYPTPVKPRNPLMPHPPSSKQLQRKTTQLFGRSLLNGPLTMPACPLFYLSILELVQISSAISCPLSWSSVLPPLCPQALSSLKTETEGAPGVRPLSALCPTLCRHSLSLLPAAVFPAAVFRKHCMHHPLFPVLLLIWLAALR